MTEFVALRSLVFAAECFFGATLFLALAWLLTRRGAASQRHLAWFGAFAAMLVLPVAALIVPPGFVLHMTAAPAPAMAETAAMTAAVLPATPSYGVVEAVRLLSVLWLAGMAVVAARMLAGLAGLALLRRKSVPHIPDGIDGEKFRGPQWQLRLRTTPGNEGPVTWGVFTATVLLPKASVQWSRARLEAVLLHEFAHVRRRDSLARLVALLACAFYWPNPFVWTAARRLREEAEIAADDCVLEAGVRASSYAEELVGLAGEYGHVSFAGVAVSMAERSSLKMRVQSVLAAARARTGVNKMDVLKIAALGAAVLATLALVRPGLAETKPAAVTHQTIAVPPVPEASLAPLTAPVPPPAPEVAPVPPVPPAKDIRTVHVIRLKITDGDHEMTVEEPAAGAIDKAMAEARLQMEKAVVDAKKQRQVFVIKLTENKQLLAGTAAARVQALEQARAEIDRQLAEARKEAADGKRPAAKHYEAND